MPSPGRTGIQRLHPNFWEASKPMEGDPVCSVGFGDHMATESSLGRPLVLTR